MPFKQQPIHGIFSTLSVDSLFHQRGHPSRLFRKTGERTYVEDGLPAPQERTMKGDPTVFYHTEHPLPDLDILSAALTEGHGGWVARMIVERRSTWQAVLVGVKIAEEHGCQAALLLTD